MFCRIFKAIWAFIENLVQRVADAASDWEQTVNLTRESPCKEVFIWGAPLRHMTNDIEVVYCPGTKKYQLKLDTSWLFDTKEEELAFLKALQHKFLDYLEKNNHPEPIDAKYIFWMSNPGELFVAESIEELFVNYSIFVAGYETMFCQQKGNTYDY